MIDKFKHYFVLMRPINIVSLIGWVCTPSSDPEKWVECEVVEDKYKVEDGYKVTLQSIESGYGREHYYQTDFNSLLKSGFILEKERESQHVELMKWYEPLIPTVNVQHQAYVVVESELESILKERKEMRERKKSSGANNRFSS